MFSMNGQANSKVIKIAKHLIFIFYIFVLFYLVLLKGGDAIHIAAHFRGRLTWLEKLNTINFIPFKTIAYYLSSGQSYHIVLTNLLGNILAFCPMVFLLPMLISKRRKMIYTLFITVLIGLSIEVSQLIFMLGSCDIDDMILYICGGILGYLAYVVFLKLQRSLKILEKSETEISRDLTEL